MIVHHWYSATSLIMSIPWQTLEKRNVNRVYVVWLVRIGISSSFRKVLLHTWTLAQFRSYGLGKEKQSTKKIKPTARKKPKKNNSSRDSQLVTHVNTNLPVYSLSTGERTGSSVFCNLWPLLTVILFKMFHINFCFASEVCFSPS